MPRPEAPFAGEAVAIDGVVVQPGVAFVVNECSGVAAVFVASHFACATTNQKTRPAADVSKLVAVTPEASSGGGLVVPR